MKTNQSPGLAASPHRLRKSIVGFLDLLGFSQAVMSATPEGSQVLLDKICHAIDDSRSYVRQVLIDHLPSTSSDWTVKFFSDNLVLGYACDTPAVDASTAAHFVIRCVQRYQLRMVVNGLFLRGGLTLGPLCLTDEIIFGKALIESYQLEEKFAVVPRVVLSESLSQIVVQSLQSPNDETKASARDALCRDIDGWWFVNYLQAAEDGGRLDWDLIERHKHSVLQSLSSTNRHDVLPKYGWVCRYHNMFCHWHQNDPGYSAGYRIERDDEQSVIRRLGEG
jgi:hypothetical protein